ncbi:DapH/DapD/GlmU-related protein [Atopobium sp. oral taxon 416]|uniref:acyltransferase n=1 Tax=Atopobium sp. oral taxon 416 TaxID=712157 RepID=UPI001BAB925E|nr:acyltransferase [Atopobium sp. oral taxon 416]QUC03753.1 acyltransferase [Atopobium sp. oral taxon 416]
MFLTELAKRVVLRERRSSDAYCDFLRDKGIRVGRGTEFFSPGSVLVDLTRPYMISIGDNVQITSNVTILTHDYSWSVIKGMYGDVLGSCAEVSIGSNVFIGMNTTILKGTHIGDNVVIGAGSLVNHDIASGCVAAGSPCEPICTIEEYAERYRARQVDEAYYQYRGYVLRYGRPARKEEFREFFWLFCDRGEVVATPEFDAVMDLVEGSRPLSERRFNIVAPTRPFETFEDFVAYCDSRMAEELRGA